MADAIFRRVVRIERPAAEVFAWHERSGAFGRLCPPNSCSTTRIDPRDRLRPLHPVARLRRLRPLPPLRPWDRLVQDHPAHLLVPADLQDPPPNWDSSKWFYWLNIPNTTTMTPFAKYM